MDVIRGGGGGGHWLFVNSWWLTLPLIFDAIFLCPAVMFRAQRAKKAGLPAAEAAKANQALLIAVVLLVIIMAYLIRVLAF